MFIFCLIPFSRGIEETGRKNAFAAPFFYLAMTHFANGLWLYINESHEGHQEGRECDYQSVYFTGHVIAMSAVAIFRAQMIVSAHSIATIEYEMS